MILSNVDSQSFAASQEQLGVTFDHVFTAEDIGSYKPDIANFEFMLARLGDAGFRKSEILHVAQSLFHDHAPANRLGVASAWIDRRRGRAGSGATRAMEMCPHYDFEFDSLRDLVDYHHRDPVVTS